MPTASERLIRDFGNGFTLPVFDTKIGRMRAAICRENSLPLLRATCSADGIELDLAAHHAPHSHGRPLLCAQLQPSTVQACSL